MTSVGPGPGVAAGDIGDAKLSEPANKRESPASFCNRDSRHHGMATPVPRTSTTAEANYPSHNALLARQSSRKPQYAPAGSSIPLVGSKPHLVRKSSAGEANGLGLAVKLGPRVEIDFRGGVEPDRVPCLTELRRAVFPLEGLGIGGIGGREQREGYASRKNELLKHRLAPVWREGGVDTSPPSKDQAARWLGQITGHIGGEDRGEAAGSRLPLPAGFAQPIEQVSVVFRPKPRHTIVHVHVECGRREINGLVQGILCFCVATELSECGRRPAINHREIRI